MTNLFNRTHLEIKRLNVHSTDLWNYFTSYLKHHVSEHFITVYMLCNTLSTICKKNPFVWPMVQFSSKNLRRKKIKWKILIDGTLFNNSSTFFRMISINNFGVFGIPTEQYGKIRLRCSLVTTMIDCLFTTP